MSIKKKSIFIFAMCFVLLFSNMNVKANKIDASKIPIGDGSDYYILYTLDYRKGDSLYYEEYLVKPCISEGDICLYYNHYGDEYLPLSTGILNGDNYFNSYQNVTRVYDNESQILRDGSESTTSSLCLYCRYVENLVTNMYVFSDYDSAKLYLETGEVTNVLIEPTELEPIEDNTQGFEQFQVCRVRDSSISGGYGALVTYELPSGTFVDGKEKKIVYNLTYSFDLGCNTSFSLRDKKSGSVSFTVEDILTKDYGQREFDFIKLCEECDAFSSSDILTIIRSMNNYCKQKGIPFSWELNIPVGVLDIGTEGTFAYYESFSVDYLDLSISAYYTDGVSKSKESYAYIDLVQGTNQSTAINGDDILDDGTISEGETIKKDNMMDVKKQLNPDGTISYVDVNVDVDIDGSGGGAGSVTQNNNVSIPDEITVNLNGYWSDSGGSGDDITIEDDDYTPDALKNVIDGAYGVFDNLSTEKNDDGFLALLSGFLGALNPDLGGMISFGMGSVIVISILRSLINR